MNNLNANLTISEQTKLNLFIEGSINLKYISANFLSNEKSRPYLKKTERRRVKNWIRLGRESLWWDNVLSGFAVDQEWIENFQMSRKFLVQV